MTLAQATSPTGEPLELMLVRNHFLLLTRGALYSDGKSYLPALTLAERLKPDLGKVGTVLVLGVGVGSIVHVLRARGCHPRYTLVENDRVVLGWAMDTLVDERHPDADNLEPVCQDAEAFMAENQRTFDVIFVDLFKGRKVPPFVTTPVFLRRCRKALSPGGRVVLNYLADDEQQWAKLRALLLAIFPGADVASIRDNRIMVSEPAPPA